MGERLAARVPGRRRGDRRERDPFGRRRQPAWPPPGSTRCWWARCWCRRPIRPRRFAAWPSVARTPRALIPRSPRLGPAPADSVGSRRPGRSPVDLELSDDQELFRETTARFIDARCPIPRVRELADTPVAHDPALLGEAGELGWFALFVPEEHGGGSVSGSPLPRRGDRRRGARPLRAARPVRRHQRGRLRARARRQRRAAVGVPPRPRGRRAHRVVGDQRPQRRARRPARCAPLASGDGYTLDGVAGLVPEGRERRRVPGQRRPTATASPSSWSTPTRPVSPSRRSTDSTSPVASPTCASTACRCRRARCSARRAARRRASTRSSTSRSRSRWPSRSAR